MESLQDVLKMRAAIFADPDAPRANIDTPVSRVIRMLKDNPEHIVYVVDELNRLVGLITDQDVLVALATAKTARKIADDTLVAGDIMKPINIKETKSLSLTTDTLEDVIAKLGGEKRLKVMPVINPSGSPVGQVSRASIQRNLNELLK
jgi:CBS domain-containing protein